MPPQPTACPLTGPAQEGPLAPESAAPGIPPTRPAPTRGEASREQPGSLPASVQGRNAPCNNFPAPNHTPADRKPHAQTLFTETPLDP